MGICPGLRPGQIPDPRMDSLRFGILSTARVGRRRVVPAMQQAPNIVVRAVASRDGERAHAFARTLNIPKAYGRYEDLLADPEVDAVYIPLPNALHCQWTVKAAQAGKHVLCEKPLAANAQEADEMIAACEANHVLLMEAFMYRFHPQNEHLLALIQDGAIRPIAPSPGIGAIRSRRWISTRAWSSILPTPCSTVQPYVTRRAKRARKCACSTPSRNLQRLERQLGFKILDFQLKIENLK